MKRKVKAWMIGCPWKKLAKKNGKIPKMFYTSKTVATKIASMFRIENEGDDRKVIPVTITYEIPKGGKRK